MHAKARAIMFFRRACELGDPQVHLCLVSWSRAKLGPRLRHKATTHLRACQQAAATCTYLPAVSVV